MPTQKNSASWDLQLGFNLAFKRLNTPWVYFDSVDYIYMYATWLQLVYCTVYFMF